MENLLVCLIVGAAALHLLKRLRRLLSGKGGCGCGCSGGKRLPMASACSCCSSQKRQKCDCQ